jgi:hypothetical protein
MHFQAPIENSNSPPEKRIVQLTKRQRKRERRDFRKSMLAFAEGSGKETPPQTMPPRWSRAFLDVHSKAVFENLFVAYSFSVNFDNTPSSLMALDKELPQSLDEVAKSLGFDLDANDLLSLYAGVGVYLGMVLVRALGAKWCYPGRLVRIAAWSLRRPEILYKHWFVSIDSRKIPIFEIAKRRETLGKDRASLIDAYDEIVSASSN